MQTKQHILFLFLYFFPIVIFCQINHGISFDNYSGIYGAITNPANSVDSKYSIHVNVLSYNQLGVSDIGSITNFNIETAPNGLNGLEFTNNLKKGKNEGYSYSQSDVLLPSVVWNFHEKFAVGLLTRSRTFYDYNNVSSSLLKGANKGFSEDFEFNNSQLNNTTHSWSEIGLNLSAVLINANYHFIKFGTTLKYVVGKGGNELRGSMGGSLNNTNNNLNLNGNLISLNSFDNQTSSSSKSFIQSAFDFSNKGTGFSGDIGLVYEWRPRETNRVDVRSNSGAVNKYKLKISASLLDVGDITYKEATQEIIDFNLNVNANTYDPNNGLLKTITDERANTSVNVVPAIGEATFALPMSLNLNLDYIILNNNNYYININYIKGLTTATDVFANTVMNLITVTPRYETRKFSVYLPVNIETTSGITAGLGLRYGPVTIGTAALSSMFTDGKMQHLYFGVSVPLMKDLYR